MVGASAELLQEFRPRLLHLLREVVAKALPLPRGRGIFNIETKGAERRLTGAD